MTNEIIKLIEYITGSPVVRGAFIAYIVFGGIIVATAFIITLRIIFEKRGK